VQLTEAFGAIKDRQPTMRHRRCFKNASSEQLLSVLLGLKFYGEGGLMVDSIAGSEEDAQDGSSRFIKNFRPLGYSFFSVLAGTFSVHQELFECSLEPHGVVATIRMSFSPSNSKDHEPTASFLWDIEPDRANEQERRACWTESINTQETLSRQTPELKIKTGSRWIFLFGHNRVIGQASQRIANVLNARDDSGLVFANHAEADRLNFWPSKSGFVSASRKSMKKPVCRKQSPPESVINNWGW
jgi:hypothetical protein